MSAVKSYRQESKRDWGSSDEGFNLDQIKAGAILRIADASEKMASNYDALLRDRDFYKLLYNSERDAHNRTQRQNAGLRGYIKRLKGAK